MAAYDDCKEAASEPYYPVRVSPIDERYIFEFIERDFMIWCSGEVSLFLRELR